jgi:hypothetical protein
MNGQILSLVIPESKPMPFEPLPYTRESVAKAKAFQQSVRLKTALELGIPRDLIELYDVFGFEQMRQWTLVLTTLREQ